MSNEAEIFGEYLISRGRSRATADTYTIVVENLLKYTKKTPQTLTYEDVVKYVTEIKTGKSKGVTKKSMFSAIKKYLWYLKSKHKNTAYDDYLVEANEDINIFEVTDVQTADKIILTKEEIQKLLKSTEKNPRDYAIIMTFYYTSARGNSISHLNKQDIDWEGEINPKDKQRYHKIQIRNAKGNYHYKVDVPTECITAIKDYLAVREEPDEGFVLDNYGHELLNSDAIFLNGSGGRFQQQSMRLMLNKYATLSKIGRSIGTHIFRTTTISYCDQSGMSLGEIMQRSGHRNVQSVRPYLKPSADDVNFKSSIALKLIDTVDAESEEKLKNKFREFSKT